MAVCAPLTAYRIGRRRLRSAAVVIVAASVAFNAPRFFEFRPTSVPLSVDQSATSSSTPAAPGGTATMIVLGDTWLRSDEVYQYVYNTAMNNELTLPATDLRLNAVVGQSRCLQLSVICFDCVCVTTSFANATAGIVPYN